MRMISSGYSFDLPILLGFTHKSVSVCFLSLRYVLTILSIFFDSVFSLYEGEDRTFSCLDGFSSILYVGLAKEGNSNKMKCYYLKLSNRRFMMNLDLSKPIEIAEDVFWIG
jgi:hypothetical protein